jgi:hypothetical protein
MGVAVNNIFKLLSLRGPAQLSEQAIAGVEPTELFKELDAQNPDPENPSEELTDIINRHRPISQAEAEASLVAVLHKALDTLKKCTVEVLKALKVGRSEDEKLTLEELIGHDNFKKDMSKLSDSWLAIRLGTALNKKRPDEEPLVNLADAPDIDLIEKLLRSGWLAQRYVQAIDTLRRPGACKQLLNLTVVYPRQWRARRHQRMKVEVAREKRAKAEAEKKAKEEDKHKSKLDAAKEERSKLVQEIKHIESIQKKASLVHSELVAEAQKRWRESEKPRPGRERGLIGRAFTYVFGETVGRGEPAEPPTFEPPKVDEIFEKKLTSTLTNGEKETYKAVKEKAVGERPPLLSSEGYAASWGVQWGDAVHEANDLCSKIQVWEEEATRPDTSRPPQQITELNRPSVRAIGFGELIVARERLIGYEANEIAHIENVLPHEDRLREHERTTTREVVTETETLEETKSEKHLETTDRYELQTQSEKAVHEEFSIDAGVNTSGKYGLTTIETSLEAGFSRSVDESHSSTSNLAKEVVSRAVEETHKRARELRRVTVTEQIRELNKHGIKGEKDPFSGVYYWVEKIHEVELRHYGTRLMVEFYIPEPGLSLLPENNKETLPFKKPAPLAVGPADIEPDNYLCLATKYGATDVEPPPPSIIQVGYKWASTPDEAAQHTKAEDTVGEIISIPEGYVPDKAFLTFTSRSCPGSEYANAYFYAAIGGIEICDDYISGKELTGELKRVPAPDGLPISLRVSEHFDKTAVVNVRVDCERTDAAMHAWRLKIFERIKEAHELMVAEYERKVAQAEIRGGIEIIGRHPAENRAREIEELKKWSIKTMRVSTFEFDAVVQELGQQEIDPVRSDEDAPVVRFFEEAFEWRQMSYFLYAYYWGRRDSYGYRHRLQEPDPLHQQFLCAGGARVIVPVTPGYEERILHYLNTPGGEEMDRVTWQPPPPPENPDEPFDVPVSEAEDVWIEVLMNKNHDVQRGTGTLNVKKDDDVVTINTDSIWYPDVRDLGRELYIAGDVYTVIEVISSTVDDRKIRLDRPYELDDNPSARYAAGSVPIGSPWEVRLPTSLVILSEQKSKLKVNIQRKQYGEDDKPPE